MQSLALQRGLALLIMPVTVFMTLMAKIDSSSAGEAAAGESSGEVSLPQLVAHRGASHDAPENTLPAFELAWEQGADAIEGDFHLTSDGRIICFHDKTMERMTEGRDARAVAGITFEELRSIDVGAWKGERWKGVRMPSLEEVLAVVPEEKEFLIEIKCGPEIVPALRASLASAALAADQLRIISFNADVIARCREQLPEIKAFWLTGYSEEPEGSGQWRPAVETVLQTLQRTRASGLDSNAHDLIDAAFVRRLREAEQEFHVWTVDDPAVAVRFARLGVDSITTNRPAWLREQMRDRMRKGAAAGAAGK